MNLFDELKAALAEHDDWPTIQTQANVIGLARRLVDAVDQRSAVIEQMRRRVTPTNQALNELISDSVIGESDGEWYRKANGLG